MSRLRRFLTRLLANSLLVSGALLFCLLALEAALRLAPSLDIVRPTPIRVDPSNHLRLLPNHKDHYATTELSFDVISNSLGRRDREWSPEQLQRADSLLFIGDSFAMGYGSNDEHSIPTLMEGLFTAAAQNREVLNFGMPGEVALPEYQALLEESVQFGVSASTVIVGVFLGNDFNDLDRLVLRAPEPETPADGPTEEEPRGSSFPTSLDDLRSVEYLRTTVKSSPRLVGLTLRFGRLFGLQVHNATAAFLFAGQYSDVTRQKLERQLSILLKMRARVAERSADFHVVVFPNKIQVENYQELADTPGLDPESPNRLVRDFCERHALSCLDLLSTLRQKQMTDPGLPLYFPVDRHFTPRANQIVAQAIHDFLQKPAGRDALISGR